VVGEDLTGLLQAAIEEVVEEVAGVDADAFEVPGEVPEDDGVLEHELGVDEGLFVFGFVEDYVLDLFSDH